MKSHTLLILLGTLFYQPCAASGVPKIKPGYQETFRAAYLGKTAWLEKLIDEEGGCDPGKWTDDAFDIYNILGYVMEGNRPEVIRLFIRKGFPKDCNEVSKLFACSRMDVPTARLLVESIPHFIRDFGVYALSQANRGTNMEVVHYLLDQGADPNGVVHGNPKEIVVLPILKEALVLRRREIVNDLLNHGADPYANGIMDSLLLTHSANLIRFVDREHRYAKVAEALEKEYGAPQGSPFPGTWAYREEGCNSEDLILNKDGTGAIFLGLGGMGFVWRGDKQHLDISFVSCDPSADLKHKWSFQLDADGKILHSVRDGKVQTDHDWTRRDAAPLEIEVRLAPAFVEIQVVRLSSDMLNIQLQVNGRHVEVPISRFLKAGKAEDPETPLTENLLNWSAFVDGPLETNPSKKWIAIPFCDRQVTAGYRHEPDSLGFDHESKTETLHGQDYTLFPCGSEPWHEDGLPCQGFVLLSKSLLPNGKHLMYFYVKPYRVMRSTGTLM